MTIEESPVTGQLTLTCPDCGAAMTTAPGRRSSVDFCPECDFPMFWARPSDLVTATDSTDDALRRLPGVEGTRAQARAACPSCAEPNAPDALRCLRCGGPMVLASPAPLPEPPAPEPALPVIVEEVVACDHIPTWQVVFITAIITVSLCAMLAITIIAL